MSTRVTQDILHAEADADAALAVTQLGAYTELEGESVRVTQLGVYVEVASDTIRVTQLGVYLELEYVPPSMSTAYATPVGGRSIFSRLPDAVEGYAFDPEHSWWSIVVPEATENLILNPSFENRDDWDVGYTMSGWSSAAQSSSLPIGATRGRYSARLVPNPAGVEATVTYAYTATVNPYTWSLDLYNSRPGATVNLSVRDASNNVVATKTFPCKWVGWRRLYITWVHIATGSFTLRLTSPATNTGGGNDFYTDGWQLETKRYPTTYTDGDMTGYYDQTPNESYAWRGARHTSTSVRFAKTGSGGRLISFSDIIDFRTTGIVGLGMSPVEPKFITLANGQEVPIDNRTLPRDFTITGRIMARSWPDLARRRAEFIRLVRPNNTPDKEHVPLRYQVLDAVGNPIGSPLEILCTYKAGLEGNQTNLFQEIIGLQFHSSFSYATEVIDSQVSLTLRKILANNGIVYRDINGDFLNLGSGSSGTVTSIDVADFLESSLPIIGGVFSAIGAVSVTNLAYWTGTTWAAFGSPSPNAKVFDTHTGRNVDGLVAVVGLFTNIGNRAAIWNGSAWVHPQGVGFNGQVTTVARSADGDFYFGGFFTNKGDSSNPLVSRIARYDYTANVIYPMAAGVSDGHVMTIVPGNDGYVYFGGEFTTESGAGGISPRVARYNIENDSMQAMGTGFNDTVNQMFFHTDGYLYAVGEFTQDGSANYDLGGFARWNGIYWEEVFDLNAISVDNRFTRVTVDRNGIFWFYSTEDNFINVPGLGTVSVFGWLNGIFYPPMWYKEGSIQQGASHIAINDANEMIAVWVGPGTPFDLYVPALNSITYSGDADASPEIVLYGSMSPLFIENLSVQAGIYFRSTLETGLSEEVRIQTGLVKQRVYSNSRPNMLSYINVGATSLRSFRLLPGVNRISIFVNPLDAGAEGHMLWRNTYWGMDAGPGLA